MRRFALMLATLGILCVAAGQAQAHGYRPYYGGHGYHHGYCAPAVVYPRVWAPPVVVVPPRAYPPVYVARPGTGFYYQGRGVSIGIGF